MAEGRQSHDWNLAAHQLALVWNLNRGPKESAKSPGEFNAYALSKAPKREVVEGSIKDFARAIGVEVPE